MKSEFVILDTNDNNHTYIWCIILYEYLLLCISYKKRVLAHFEFHSRTPCENSKWISGSLAPACALSPSFNRYSCMPWCPVVVLSSWTVLLPSFAERAILFIVLVKIWLRITWFLLKTCLNTFQGFLRLSCHRISINAVSCYEDVVKIISVLFSKISS